jgi:alpha-L-fucosidase
MLHSTTWPVVKRRGEELMTLSDTIQAPAPWGPTPSAAQLRWHSYETYGFVHFTVNTFTNLEWGLGGEEPAVFNPADLDARQWVQAAKDAGLKGLILTAKHHDGFCLWPSPHTAHSVESSPWRGGRGDVVTELAEACREGGIRFGVYLSPWDRNHADYATPAYLDYYKAQLEEVTTKFGDLFEVWFDGANGGTGYYGGANEERKIDHASYYRFPELWSIVRRNQPDAVMFSDAGPDIRWVGNEDGLAPDTCWCRVDPEGTAPGIADVMRLAHGEADGPVWRPAEVDVSIRKGWFYHPEEEPKTPAELMNIYMKSVGRGCCLLLNLTPDRRGLIPDADIASLREWRRQLDALYAEELPIALTASDVRGQAPVGPFAAHNATDGAPDTYWTTDDDVTRAVLTARLAEPAPLGLVRLEEYIPLGQRVEGFTVWARVGDAWQEVTTGGTIGPRRIIDLGGLVTDALMVEVKALACPVISRFSVFRAPQE